MLSLLNKLFGSQYQKDLKQILTSLSNREEMLGMKTPIIPTPEGIRVDSTKILQYTESTGYKKFTEEAWAQIIHGFDKILDERATNEVRQYYCGMVRGTLDLLRMSHKAKYVIEQWDKEHPASLRPKK